MKNKQTLEHLLKYEIGGSPVPNYKLADKIAKFGNDAVTPLINLVNKSESIASLTASLALGLIGNKNAIQPLLDALKRYSFKSPFIQALGKLEAHEAKEILKEYLTRRHTSWDAAAVLYHLGEKEMALPYILEELKPVNSFFGTPQGLEIRRSAAYLCADYKIENAVDELYNNIIDLSRYAIEALIFIGGEKVKNKASELVSLSEPDIRSLYGVFIFGLLQDTAMIPDFIDMLNDYDKYVARYRIDINKDHAGWTFVLDILGNYSDAVPKNEFQKRLDENRIIWYIWDYYNFQHCKSSYGYCSRYKLRSAVVVNNGWDNYLKNELYSKAFAAEPVPSTWDVEDGPIEYQKKIVAEVITKIMKNRTT